MSQGFPGGFPNVQRLQQLQAVGPSAGGFPYQGAMLPATQGNQYGGQVFSPFAQLPQAPHLQGMFTPPQAGAAVMGLPGRMPQAAQAPIIAAGQRPVFGNGQPFTSRLQPGASNAPTLVPGQRPIVGNGQPLTGQLTPGANIAPRPAPLPQPPLARPVQQPAPAPTPARLMPPPPPVAQPMPAPAAPVPAPAMAQTFTMQPLMARPSLDTILAGARPSALVTSDRRAKRPVSLWEVLHGR